MRGGGRGGGGCLYSIWALDGLAGMRYLDIDLRRLLLVCGPMAMTLVHYGNERKGESGRDCGLYCAYRSKCMLLRGESGRLLKGCDF